MNEVQGWQHNTETGKRGYIEFRNELPFKVAVEVVRVKATNNYFIYLRPEDSEEKENTIVPANYYEVVKISESDF